MLYGAEKRSSRSRTVNAPPADYTTPPFPSLYSPIGGQSGNYLYRSNDVWRFTLFWTLIIFEAFHLAASGYAVALQPEKSKWKILWIVPLVYFLVGGIEAVISGSVVGLM